MFVPAKSPGNFYSVNRAASGRLSQAITNGRPGITALGPGAPIALNQVRGTQPIPSRSTVRPMVRSQVVSAFGSAMNVSKFPSVPVCGRTAPDSAPDFFPSGQNPYWLNRSAQPYGRQLRGLEGIQKMNGQQLRGLGLLPDSSTWGDTWSGGDKAVADAAQADDVAGNGIFDGEGVPPTAHAGSGVFESKFSLPGYLYREMPTEPSEIRDTTTGMPVVYQPDAGGSWADDVRDAYRPFDLETPRLYGQNPLVRPPMVPAVRIPRINSVSGMGEFETPSTDTLKAVAGWTLLGVGVAVAIRLMMASMQEAY